MAHHKKYIKENRGKLNMAYYIVKKYDCWLYFWSFRSCWEEQAIWPQKSSNNHSMQCNTTHGNAGTAAGLICTQDETKKGRYFIRHGFW